jgi:hypothetical protein
MLGQLGGAAMRCAMLAIFLVTATAADARDLAICGASVGTAYFPPVSAFAEKLEGFQEDGISGGRMTLVQLAEKKFDLIVADASGGLFSASQDGAVVVMVGRSETYLAVAAVYPLGSMETYAFMRTSQGDEVIWSSLKYGTPIPKVGAYRAKCSFLDLSQ